MEIVLTTPPPITHRTAEENLGIAYLASILRDSGYIVHIIDAWLQGLSENELTNSIMSINGVSIVGFSCYLTNMFSAVRVMNQLKKQDRHIKFIAGGYGPTFSSSYFLDAGFDIVVRGEGEKVIVPLADFLIQGIGEIDKICGISYRFGGKTFNNSIPSLIENISSLPYPARDTLSSVLERKSAAHIVSSRGCYANCIFCSIVSFMKLSEGSQWRHRSISDFCLELKKLQDRGVRVVKVLDDSFIEPPRDVKWCESLKSEIKKNNINIRLRASIRADRVSYEMLKLLKESGFFSFACGIENFSDSALKRMGKSARKKENTFALDCFHKLGMHIQVGLILFDYGTTISELWENYHALRKYSWITTKGIFSEMFAAEGSVYERVIVKKNLVSKSRSTTNMNLKYSFVNVGIENIYSCLKQIHNSWGGLYDQAIDPLTAPKDISQLSFDEFYTISQEMQKVDLDSFFDILSLAEGNVDTFELQNLTTQIISDREKIKDIIRSKLDLAYKEADILYDASINPFFK